MKFTIATFPLDSPTITSSARPFQPGKNNSAVAVALLSLLPLLTLSVIVVGVFYTCRRLRLRRKRKMLTDVIETAPFDVPECLHLVEYCDSMYRLENEIASGRYGSVYVGRNVENHAPVAVKVFLELHRSSWITEQAMLRLAGPQHTNVLRLLGTQQLQSGHLWLVTEYHELGSMYDYLREHTLSLSEVLQLSTTMARGLAHLHKFNAHKPSIAHRDFKSRNVLIKSDMTACIADLGLAIKFESREPIGDTHNQVGTRRYMAPEVLEGAIHFTRDAFLRIDIYAMSLVLWELVSRCALTLDQVHQSRNDVGAGDLAPEAYVQPFHEAGDDTPMDIMQDIVVYRKQRPRFPPFCQYNIILRALKDTIEECWDQDAEARLSASCIVERLSALATNLRPEDGATDGDSGMGDNEEHPVDEDAGEVDGIEEDRSANVPLNLAHNRVSGISLCSFSNSCDAAATAGETAELMCSVSDDSPL